MPGTFSNMHQFPEKGSEDLISFTHLLVIVDILYHAPAAPAKFEVLQKV